MSKKLSISDLPPALQARVRELAAKEGMCLVKTNPRARIVPQAGAWQGKEKDLQRVVENWLELIGFAKRNRKSIERTEGRGGRLGWMIHIRNSLSNPYMLDLLLLGRDGRWLEIELKKSRGKLTDLQDLLTRDDPDKVCRSLEDVQRQVGAWLEQECLKTKEGV